MTPAHWEIFMLGDIIAEQRIGTSERGTSNAEGQPLLKMGNLIWGGLNLDDIEMIDPKLLNEDTLVRRGDILFNTRNTPELVGKTAYWGRDEQYGFDNNIMRLRMRDGFEPEFVASWMASATGRREIQKFVCASTSVGAVYWRDLSTLAIPIPPSMEQRRIIAVLGSWNEAIGATERLIKAKGDIEAALYDSIRHDWPRHEISSLGRIVGGGTPSKDNASYWIGNIPWVSSKDMSNWLLSDTQDHISTEAVVDSATRVVPAGSILMVVRSGILRHTFPIALTTREMAINQDIKALLPERYFDSFLLGRVMRLESERLRQLTMKTGTTVESLDIDSVKEFPLPFPPPEKAESVIGLFRTLHDESAALQNELDLLRRQKRGLMQKLLTGEWPVPESIDRLMPGGDAAATLAREASAA